MIGVIATLKVQADKAAEFEAAFGELVAAVRANEPDCAFYGLHKRGPGDYVVLERYNSKAALDAHGKSAHFAAAMPKLAPFMAGAPSVEYLEGIV